MRLKRVKFVKRGREIRPIEVYIVKCVYWLVIGMLFAVGIMGIDEGVWPLGIMLPVAGVLAYSIYKSDDKQGYVDALHACYLKNRHWDSLEKRHKATERPRSGL